MNCTKKTAWWVQPIPNFPKIVDLDHHPKQGGKLVWIQNMI